MHLNETEIPTPENQTNIHLKSRMRRQLHRVLTTIRSIARSCPIEYRYPIQKLLKQLAKIFSLNEFEATFLAYMVSQTKWNFKEELISHNSASVYASFCNNNQQAEFKSIVLYLVLVVFTLKKFLNEQNQQFLEEAIKICPQFESIFEKWSKKHSKLTKKFNPKTLNKIYQDICFKASREKPNFNILVDSLLEISPPYNFDINKNKKIVQNGKLEQECFLPPKYRKAPRLITSQDSFSMIKNEEVQNNEINPIFSTERLHQMVEGVGVQHNLEVSDFQAFGFTQVKNTEFNFDKSVFGNSQYSGDLHRELKFEDYFCHDLRLGLEEGQSQQHQYIRSNNKDNKGAEQSQNMMMNSSSRINPTEEYLNWKMEGSQYNY